MIRRSGAPNAYRVVGDAGDVGDRHVEQARREQRLGEHAVQHGRGQRRPGRRAGEPPAAWWLAFSRIVSARTRRKRARDSATETGRWTKSEVMRLPSSSCSRRVADVDGHHRPQTGGRRRLAARDQQVAQRGGDEREDDVVDGAAQRALDRLDLLQRHLGHGDPAVLAERDVEAGPRRGDELVAHEQLDERAGGVEPLGGAPRMAHDVDEPPRWRPAAVPPGAGRRPGVSRLDGPGASAAAGLRRAGLRLGVEQHAARVDRADAVHEAVVRLGDQRPASAGEALRAGPCATAAGRGRGGATRSRPPRRAARARRRAWAARRG